MKVDNNSKYKLIYSVSEHPQLGVMIHPYVVAYTSLDTLSLTYQKVFSGSASHYTQLSQEQLGLIAKLDNLMVEHIVRKFSPVSKIRPKEFFRKHFDKKLRDEVIRPYVEKHLAEFLNVLEPGNDSLYVADEINPAAIPIDIKEDFTKVLFHFRRNENGTSYFVTLKHGEERVPFMKLGALLLVIKPARLIVNGNLYKFYDFVEGGKIGVFIHKKFVFIKPENERTYYTKFVKPLLETAPVFAQGFDIHTTKEEAVPLLKVANKGSKFGLELYIHYGKELFPFHENKLFHVKMKWANNAPFFVKYKRSKIWEANRINALAELGLKNDGGSFFALEEASLVNTISWLRANKEVLEISRFKIETGLDKDYSLEKTLLNYEISDKIDWFDLNVDRKSVV